MKLSIRARLTLFVTLFVGCFLICSSLVLSYLYRQSTARSFDTTLEAAAGVIATLAAERPSFPVDAEIREDMLERLDPFEARVGTIHILVYDAQGRLLVTARDEPDSLLALLVGERSTNNAEFIFHERTYRKRSTPVEFGEKNSGMIVAYTDASQLHEASRTMTTLSIIFLPIAIAIFFVGSWIISKRALSPLVRLASEIEAVSIMSEQGELRLAGTHDEIDTVRKAFIRLLQRIRALLPAQRAFLIDAAHQLKTPLTTLRVELELFAAEKILPHELRQQCDQLLSSVDQLSNLSTDLLFLARLESLSEYHVEHAEVDLIVADVVSTLHPLARSKNIHFNIILRSDSSVVVEVETFKRALSNIVENAIKYTPPNKSIAIETYVQDPSSAVIIIRDEGIGIEAEELDRVFDRFYRTKRARGSGIQGAGLGLAIAREIVESFQGSISLHGSESGTEVRICLPIVKS